MIRYGRDGRKSIESQSCPAIEVKALPKNALAEIKRIAVR